MLCKEIVIKQGWLETVDRKQKHYQITLNDLRHHIIS